MKKSSKEIIIAFPKGRILEEFKTLLMKIDVKPEPDFFDEKSRKLKFSTSNKNISFIKIRSFDVATFVAFGAAEIGIAGNDVLMEFNYPDIYSPLDLKIGKCRLSLAAPKNTKNLKDMVQGGHVRVATKYPYLTQEFFSNRGVQAECVKLNGSIELAPLLGLTPNIVDLVSTGKTLKENGLVEVEKILDVTSRLIVNRTAFKTRGAEISKFVNNLKKALGK